MALDAVEEPVLDTTFMPKQADHSKTELNTLCKDILRGVISNHTYSLIPYYFMPSVNIAKQDDIVRSSGSCVFFANLIVDKLKAHNISSTRIPSTLPPMLIQPDYPYYGHVSTMFQTSAYFVLLEPAYFILKPIFVNMNGEPTNISVNCFDTVWMFQYDKQRNKIHVSEKGKRIFFYKLSTILNPSQSISYPITILNQRIPIVRYDAIRNRKIAHLSVRLDMHMLEGYSIHYEQNGGWFPPFKWTQFLGKSMQEQYAILSNWNGLSTKQCKDLGYTNPDELRKCIFAIIKGIRPF